MEYEELVEETNVVRERLKREKKITAAQIIAYGVLAVINIFVAVTAIIRHDISECMSFSVIAIMCFALIAYCNRHITDVDLLELSMDTIDKIAGYGKQLLDDINEEIRSREEEQYKEPAEAEQ